MTGKAIKFIHITDSHLFGNEDRKLLGMNTQTSFSAVLNRIDEEQGEDFEFFLCTGDLSQDGTVESYRRLLSIMDAKNKPHYWIPGNHDDRDNMLKVVSEDKEMNPVIDLGDWQIVMLDSQVVGSVGGNLAQSQLDLLKNALMAEPEKHTLVTMHHHPIPMNCKWLDTQQIKNSQALIDIVDEYENLKVVLWGHVHQDFREMINGSEYICTPSTCVQFKPKSSDFDVDREGPGYRYMTLNPDGTIETGVSRVNDIEFEIDYSVKGY